MNLKKASFEAKEVGAKEEATPVKIKMIMTKMLL